MLKKFLPYSKPLHDLIESGYIPSNDVNLFIGQYSWRKGKNFSISYPERTLIIPPWNDPSDYYYPVSNCDILIFDTGYAEDDYINDLAYYLFEYGAKKVKFINTDFNVITFNK